MTENLNDKKQAIKAIPLKKQIEIDNILQDYATLPDLITNAIKEYTNTFNKQFHTLYTDPAHSGMSEYVKRKDLLENFNRNLNVLMKELLFTQKKFEESLKIHQEQTSQINKCLSTNNQKTFSTLEQLTKPANVTYAALTKNISIGILEIKHIDQAPINILSYLEKSKEFILKLDNPLKLLYTNGDTKIMEDTTPYTIESICILRGNIGSIQTGVERMLYSKPCKFQKSCVNRSNCSFWHDPAKTESSDIMNFTGNSWNFCPGRPGFRQFGSYDTLEEDIHRSSQEDILIYGRQVMHDLLCFMIASALRSGE